MAEEHEEFEFETCKKCLRKQKIKTMQCGPERHSSFHDQLVGLLPSRPKPKEEKPEVRHRQECRGKPRHEPPVMEFNEDSVVNLLNTREHSPSRIRGGDAAAPTVKPSQFKSRAVYCEATTTHNSPISQSHKQVKLMELLGKAGPQARPITPGKYEDAPDAYRAGVCCLLLAEISAMDSPYQRVLRTILQNLELAIYSNYITPHAGGGTFDQVPYFELVTKLEAQHQSMIEEQERWKTIVSENQATTDGIQQHIEELNALLVNEKAKVAVLQGDLIRDQRLLRKANKENKEFDKKLTQSRALVLDASNVKANYEECMSKLENVNARYVELTKEVQRVHQNLAVARQEAADGVPKERFNKLQNDFYDLESALPKAQRYERQAETFTPRPDWLQLRGGPFIGYPTAQQAMEICEENKKLAEMNRKLEEECAAVTVALVMANRPRIVEKGKKGKGKKGKGKKK